MTDKLEQEAREAAAKLADSCTNHRANFVLGYLAAATASEKEIASLRAKLEALEASGPKAGAVPDLTDTRDLLSVLAWKISNGGGDTAIRHYENGIKESLATIDRWLAGLEGKSDV